MTGRPATGAEAQVPAEALRRAFGPERPARLGVAVSGGSDSLALLVLLCEWTAGQGTQLFAVTVDHGLRPEAAAEAEFVAGICARLGVAHATRHWSGWDGRGNLPDRARRARQTLIARWAQDQGIATVALGHTADDQAETFLMRLARGSGVDGLSAMAPRRKALGIEWVRPFLGIRRETLRDALRARGLAWVEDPSNRDTRFERVKARKVLGELAPLGIGVTALNETAARMAMAREVLDAAALDLARRACAIEAGDVVIARDTFAAAPDETRFRLLSHAIGWVASADYRPRLASLAATEASVLSGKRRTLSGCLISPTRRHLRVSREFRAVAAETAPPGTGWDRRWLLDGPARAGLEIRALSLAGLQQCPGWRETGLPRATILASPAVWAGADLVAAPLAGLANGWRATLAEGADNFFTSLIAH